ncbi:hypothetical protein EYC84_006004 [Monilinia fructicola]|uniref:Uncharacterized protein n=1 Tax=Monilinia fructicola TaxID=38448 RepID=A0A5M9K6W7_MONFR|nr:hypothetical protein EYC84_006004 [Monilinia fructicola]
MSIIFSHVLRNLFAISKCYRDIGHEKEPHNAKQYEVPSSWHNAFSDKNLLPLPSPAPLSLLNLHTQMLSHTHLVDIVRLDHFRQLKSISTIIHS